MDLWKLYSRIVDMRLALLPILIYLSLCVCIEVSYASVTEQTDEILALKVAPKGIVIELIESQESDIQWAMQAVQRLSDKLHKKFPTMPIVVVSHGVELFALSLSERKNYPKVHSLVEQLNQKNIRVEVCGTHASWRLKQEEHFPSYVRLVDEGPAQITFYEDLGYLLIEMKK